MRAFNKEWRDHPRQLITSDSASSARTRHYLVWCYRSYYKPKTMATKSQSDLSLRYPYSKV